MQICVVGRNKLAQFRQKSTQAIANAGTAQACSGLYISPLNISINEHSQDEMQARRLVDRNLEGFFGVDLDSHRVLTGLVDDCPGGVPSRVDARRPHQLLERGRSVAPP